MSAESEVTTAGVGSLAPAAERGLSGVIVKLAWPVAVERLSISVLSAVDAVLVGRYVGADGLAAALKDHKMWS